MNRSKEKLTNRIYLFLAIAFFVLSLVQLNIAPDVIMKSLDRISYISSIMFPPVLNDPVDIFGAAVDSVQVAIVGTVIGIIISLFLAIMGASNLAVSPFASYFIKTLAAFVRAVPALIWALLFIVAIGLGPVPGILALAINSIGMLVKVYAEAMEEMDRGIIDALESTGSTKLQVIFQGVLPSIMTAFVAWSVFRFDINIRYSAVLGIVGAGGIGWELVRAAQMSRYDQAIGVTIVIFIMVLMAEVFSNYIKNRVLKQDVDVAEA